MRLAILIVAAVAATAVAPSADGAVTWSADGRYLAQTSDDNRRVVLLREDGRRARTLTNASSFVWSPRGHAYAFWRRSAFWVGDAGGGDARPVVRGVYNHAVSWAPDGTRFAYVSAAGVHVVGRDGRRARRLPVCRECRGSVVELAWSPTGRQLALVTAEEAGVTKWGMSVFVSRLDGSGDREVASGAESITGLAWSRDGAWLGFGYSEWYGSSYVQIVPRARAGGKTYDGVSYFSWAPRGALLALLVPEPEDWSFARALRVVRRGAPRGVDIGRVSAHSWAPDGSRLAIAWRGWISIVRNNGRGRRLVARGNDPAWAPKGARIAFTRGPRGRRAVCIARVGGRTARAMCVLAGAR